MKKKTIVMNWNLIKNYNNFWMSSFFLFFSSLSRNWNQPAAHLFFIHFNSNKVKMYLQPHETMNVFFFCICNRKKNRLRYSEYWQTLCVCLCVMTFWFERFPGILGKSVCLYGCGYHFFFFTTQTKQQQHQQNDGIQKRGVKNNHFQWNSIDTLACARAHKMHSIA